MTAGATVEAVAWPELAVEGVRAGYGGLEVLHGVELDVPRGGVTAVLGRNGAGKSTLLSAIAGLVPVRAGRVRWGGVDVTGWSVRDRAGAGMLLVPERRATFPELTVGEHLALFADTDEEKARVPDVLERFPVLGERLEQRAGSLSGGEQQQLAMSRVLLQEPRLVLLDEVSSGLAPRVADLIFEVVADLGRRSTVVLVEQYVEDALRLADVVYVLARGEVRWAGEPSELRGGRLPV
jgi:branched-chain amino acid transport system ATP-binding protein